MYRLPTEAEWEYAARAGRTARWSFGDDENQLADYAWYRTNTWDVGLTWTQPVGTKLPNPWGLHDMYGNAWEWCQDWYDKDYYGQSPSIDPQGPSNGTLRVRRGGGFFHIARFLRSAERDEIDPSSGFAGIGARLLRIQ